MNRIRENWSFAPSSGTAPLLRPDIFTAISAFLKLLDAVGNPIASLNDTLQRVVPPPRPEFGPLTEAESHAIVMGQIGDEFEIALPARPSDTLTAWTMVPPTSQNMTLETMYGGTLFTLTGEFSFFILKAAAPGRTTVEFRSLKNPVRTVPFSFDIAPRSSPKPEHTRGNRPPN